MDQINQVPTGATGGTPEPNKLAQALTQPAQESTPLAQTPTPASSPAPASNPPPTPLSQLPSFAPKKSNVKLWMGVIGGILIIVTGVFWLLGKPTLFKGELGIIEDFPTYCTSNGGAWADFKCTYKEKTFLQKNDMENFIAAEPPALEEEALQSAIQNALVPASDVNVLIQQAQTALADANQLIADATALLGEGKPYDALTKAKNALSKIDEAKTNVGSAIGKIKEAKKLAEDPPLNGENTVVNNIISQLEKDFMALPSTIKIKDTADAIISAAEQQEAVKKALESAHQNAEKSAALAEEKAAELQAMTKEGPLAGTDDAANAALNIIKTEVNYLKNLLNDFKPNGQEDPIVKASYEKALVAKSNAEKSYEIIMAALAPKEAVTKPLSAASDESQAIATIAKIEKAAQDAAQDAEYIASLLKEYPNNIEIRSANSKAQDEAKIASDAYNSAKGKTDPATLQVLLNQAEVAAGRAAVSKEAAQTAYNAEKTKAKAAADAATKVAVVTPEPTTPTPTPTPTPEPAPQTLSPSAPEQTASPPPSAGNSGGGGGSFVIPYSGSGGSGQAQTPSISGGVPSTPSKKASSEEAKNLLGYLETPEMWGDGAKSSTIETPEMWGDAAPTAAPKKAGVGAGATGGTAYGATIQGKTGPGVLLYPVVIGAVNGLYYLARKRRKD